MTSARVTGADGFIGSQRVEAPVQQEAEERTPFHYDSFHFAGWLDENSLLDEVEIVLGNVRDSGRSQTLVQGVDTTSHLAALIGLPYSYEAPQSYAASNVQGPVNLCAAAVRAEAPLFIQTSTRVVHGPSRYIRIDEERPSKPELDVVPPRSPRMRWRRVSGPPSGSRPLWWQRSTATDPVNGPMRRSRRSQPVAPRFRSGTRKRPVTCILYPTRKETVLKIAEASRVSGQVINVGGGTEASIAQVIEIIEAVMGSDLATRTQRRMRSTNADVYRLVCDSTRMQTLTGFVVHVGLEKDTTRTVEWFSRAEASAGIPDPAMPSSIR